MCTQRSQAERSSLPMKFTYSEQSVHRLEATAMPNKLNRKRGVGSELTFDNKSAKLNVNKVGNL